MVKYPQNKGLKPLIYKGIFKRFRGGNDISLNPQKSASTYGQKYCLRFIFLQKTTNPNPFPIGKIWFGFFWFV